MIKKLSAEEVYRICDPAMLGCETSQNAAPLDTIVGQERAVRAMQFGLGIQNKGFNIFVSGMPGTGRTTAIERFLNENAAKRPVPSDWCYINNFHDPLKPNAVRLPAGKAIQFKHDLERTTRSIVHDLQAAFEADEYNAHKEQLENEVELQKQEMIKQLNQQAEKEGFVLQPSPMGILSIPTRKGHPLKEEEFLELSEQEKSQINENQQRLTNVIESVTNTAKNLDKKLRE